MFFLQKMHEIFLQAWACIAMSFENEEAEKGSIAAKVAQFVQLKDEKHKNLSILFKFEPSSLPNVSDSSKKNTFSKIKFSNNYSHKYNPWSWSPYPWSIVLSLDYHKAPVRVKMKNIFFVTNSIS